MKSNHWQRHGWMVAAGGAALIAGLALIVVSWQESGPSRPQPQTVWAELIEAAHGRLRVQLTPAPTATTASPGSSANGKTMTVILTPTTVLTADYFVGDLVSGERVYSQPLRLDKLRAGVRLKLTLVAARGAQWEARAVSWPQSIRGSQPTSAEPGVNIPPPISPP